MPVPPGRHINIAVHATDPAQLAEAILLSFTATADTYNARSQVPQRPESNWVPEEDLAVFQQELVSIAASARDWTMTSRTAPSFGVWTCHAQASEALACRRI